MTIKSNIKDGLIKVLASQGIAVQWLDTYPKEIFKKCLTFYKIDQVIDVGANDGQFASSLYKQGFSGNVFCFEPLSTAHNRLLALAKSNPKIRVMPRAAVGSEPGRVTINIAGNSQSSSILEMLQQHKDAAPQSKYVGSEDVDIVYLDQFLDSFPAPSGGRLLKIDTQGFEMEVLKGGSKFLAECDAVYVELSFTPLYLGQPQWHEVSNYLLEAGFELWNMSPAFMDKSSGRVLQADGLFGRTKSRSTVTVEFPA